MKYALGYTWPLLVAIAIIGAGVLEKFGLSSGLISLGVGLALFWVAFIGFKEAGERKQWPLH